MTIAVGKTGSSHGTIYAAQMSVKHIKKTSVTTAVQQSPVVAPPAQSTQPTSPPVTPAPAVIAPAPVLTGKDAWLSASNISASDYGYADYIVSHESTWNPDATEPNSGAHGLPQALPYGKTGCGWEDAVCQLNWANSYAVSRYGSWGAAYAYWVNNHNW